MKLRISTILVLCLFISTYVSAQTEETAESKHAMAFADSLVKSFKYENWEQYLSLSYPGVVKYYGGKNGYIEYIRRARANYGDSLEETPEKLKLIQMINDIDEWQCVVEKTRETVVNGKKAHVVSYMVGQSKDDGSTWRFFDVAYNSVENVIYIMPDVFGTLSIPQRSTVIDDDLTYEQKKPVTASNKKKIPSKSR